MSHSRGPELLLEIRRALQRRETSAPVLPHQAHELDHLEVIELMDPPLVPVDPQVLAADAGGYQSPNDTVVTIRVDNTRIFIQAPNQPEYELYARSENRFHPSLSEAEITFYGNASGEVDRMEMMQFGERNEAKKIP
jgi:hypothetical protein